MMGEVNSEDPAREAQSNAGELPGNTSLPALGAGNEGASQGSDSSQGKGTGWGHQGSGNLQNHGLAAHKGDLADALGHAREGERSDTSHP